MRENKLTSSTVHTVLTKYRKNPSATFLRDSIPPNNPNLSKIPCVFYGSRTEPIAKQRLAAEMPIHHKAFHLDQDGGVITREDLPNCLASPDALWSCECCTAGQKVPVEIKCPYTSRTLSNCRYMKDGKLRHSSPYYTQIQWQMFLQNACIGFFVVFLSESLCVEKIEKNDALWEEFLNINKNY